RDKLVTGVQTCALPISQYDEGDIRAERREFVRGSATYLRDHFHEVPVMLIPCIEGRLDVGTPTFAQASVWGSLLPAVWSFMLARSEERRVGKECRCGRA